MPENNRGTVIKNGVNYFGGGNYYTTVVANAYMKNTGKQRCYLLITGDAERDFEQVCLCTTEDKIDCVVIGDAGDRITYNSLNTAFRYLMKG